MAEADSHASSWPEAPRPSAPGVERRRTILLAAAAGDPLPAHKALDHPDDRVRSTALLALHQLHALDDDHVLVAYDDPSSRVRRQLATIAAADHRVDLAALINDRDSVVTETACWAAGERVKVDNALVVLLASIATNHDDTLCRESAVAALGSIGAAQGLPAILAATKDRPTVRRRAVLALAPFETPEVTAALKHALEDRDWQVRQAAEDLLAAD